MIKFNKAITITVPEAVQENTSVKDYLKEYTQRAGGVTVTPATGQWYSDSGKLYNESVSLYEWFLNPTEPEDIAFFVTRTWLLANSLLIAGEEAVTIKLGQTAYIMDIDDVRSLKFDDLVREYIKE